MSKTFVMDERVLETVTQTKTLSIENFEAVCKLAVRLFNSEKQSKRRLVRTASASGWESEQMEKAVLAIAKLLMDSAKADMCENAFRMLVKGMSLPEQNVDVLVQLYQVHVNDIRASVSRETERSISRYRNLEWRIDLELGTRFRYNKTKPIVTLRLDTTTPHLNSSTVPQIQTNCFRVDYDGLKLMQRQLEDALMEADSVHCSRIQRYMK